MKSYIVFCYDLPGECSLRQSTDKSPWKALRFFKSRRAAVEAAYAARLDWARVTACETAVDRNVVTFVGNDVYVDHVLKARMSS